MEFEMMLKTGIGTGVFFLFCLAGWLFSKKGAGLLSVWAEKTPWKIDDILITVLRKHVSFWLVLAGFYLALFPLLQGRVSLIALRLLTVLFLGSLTLACSSVIISLIKHYSSRLGTTMAMSGLTVSVSRVVVLGLGGLMILNSLGISITPLLTTLGIGGLAVALALQDTLSNMFAGFHIILARQIKIGDYIKLETGQEGYVQDVNWRTTKIRVLPNNIVLIPNSRLAQVIVTNYYLPQKEMSVMVEAGVHYDSDLEKVEKVALETARSVVKEVEGAVPDFEPLFRFHTFDNSSINFTVIFRAREFFDQYRLKNEYIKRLHKRFAEEKIVIPYPITALNLTQEESFKYFKKGV